jgi:hypothetical protein
MLAGRLHQVVRFDYRALLLNEAASNTHDAMADGEDGPTHQF